MPRKLTKNAAAVPPVEAFNGAGRTNVPRPPGERKRSVSILDLPAHFQVTEPELAVLSRLVRVMRQKDNRGAIWLGPFIEWLLYRDAEQPDFEYQTSAGIFADLKFMGSADDGLLRSPRKFIKAARRHCPGITFVSRTAAALLIRGKAQAFPVLPVDEEDEFYELVRMWRKQYPEPPRRPQFPRGKTQHEMDPDSD